MQSIKPEELSGLMDGELTPEREAEVRKALTEDPKLAAILKDLQSLDFGLNSAGKSAQMLCQEADLRPCTLFSRPCRFWPRLSLVAIIAAAVMLRTLNFTLGPATGILIVNALALAGVLTWLVVDAARSDRPLTPVPRSR